MGRPTGATRVIVRLSARPLSAFTHIWASPLLASARASIAKSIAVTVGVAWFLTLACAARANWSASLYRPR